MKRITNWLLNASNWFKESVGRKPDSIVSYFIVPRSDLQELFENGGAQRVSALLALNPILGNPKFNHYIELIFIAEVLNQKLKNNESTYIVIEDITRPKPPFS